MTKITNTTNQGLGLPGGPMVPAKGSVEAPDWAKQESNSVVKAWLNSGALVVGETSTDDDADGAGDGEGGGNDAATRERFEGMTKANLAAYIEGKGGEVKASDSKDDLVEKALALPADDE